jgi:DNA-binding CsgD family transcriptional regulator
MLVDACGTVVHVNTAARTILDQEPRSAALHEEMRRAAVGLLTLNDTPSDPGIPMRWFGEYSIEPVYADPSLNNGSPLVIVRLGTPTGPPVAPPFLESRFGLTPRQAEVAALLVRGATAKKISVHLGIRYRTARNHIQSTLSVLGVSSKAEVPARILNASEPIGNRFA